MVCRNSICMFVYRLLCVCMRVYYTLIQSVYILLTLVLFWSRFGCLGACFVLSILLEACFVLEALWAFEARCRESRNMRVCEHIWQIMISRAFWVFQLPLCPNEAGATVANATLENQYCHPHPGISVQKKRHFHDVFFLKKSYISERCFCLFPTISKVRIAKTHSFLTFHFENYLKRTSGVTWFSETCRTRDVPRGRWRDVIDKKTPFRWHKNASETRAGPMVAVPSFGNHATKMLLWSPDTVTPPTV